MTIVTPEKQPNPVSPPPAQAAAQGDSPKFQLPEIPSLAKGMKDVFSVGGLPLALLFVVAVVLLALVGQGLFTEAAGLIRTVSVFLAISSVAVFIALTLIGYLRWKTDVEVYRDSYRAELEFQDKFLLALLHYASTVGGADLSPEGRTKAIAAMAEAVSGIMTQTIAARNRLRLLGGATTEGSD